MEKTERKNSPARIAANNRYNANAYDRINVAVPKGTKDAVKACATRQGKTVNLFVKEAILEKLEREAE